MWPVRDVVDSNRLPLLDDVADPSLDRLDTYFRLVRGVPASRPFEPVVRRARVGSRRLTKRGGRASGDQQRGEEHRRPEGQHSTNRARQPSTFPRQVIPARPRRRIVPAYCRRRSFAATHTSRIG